MNSNVERFEKMWAGETPNGINRTKAQKFQQYILEHVRQTGRPMNKENALKYWTGQLQREIKESEML